MSTIDAACATQPTGWEERSNAVQKSEDKLREAMKLIEQAHRCVRDAEELIVPYMGLINNRVGCGVLIYALDDVLQQHRRTINMLLGYDLSAAVGSTPDHHI